MSEPRRTATAIVEVVLVVSTDTWGPDCTMGQIAKQAKDSAISKVRNMFQSGVGTQHATLGDCGIAVAKIGKVSIRCEEEE
jgi:hypothetical protein